MTPALRRIIELGTLSEALSAARSEGEVNLFRRALEILDTRHRGCVTALEAFGMARQELTLAGLVTLERAHQAAVVAAKRDTTARSGDQTTALTGV